ncbi:MAG: PAS domain S-box protein [Chloroflexota bacterium]|nr:PAS domain S-box protein [Chloroflexota bacterium]
MPSVPSGPGLDPVPDLAPDDDELSRAIVGQSLDAIILTDRDLVVRIWSPGAEDIYGVPASDAVGRRIDALVMAVEDDGRPLDRQGARRKLERDGSWRQRLIQRPRIGALAGRDLVIDSVVTELRAPDGTATGLLAINRDVTASARIEGEIAALASLVVVAEGARTPQQVADAALDILCRATGADAGLVTSMEPGYAALASRNVNDRTIEVILSFGQLGGPIATALQAPDAWIVGNVATAPLREDVREAVLADGIRHVIVLGLRPAGRLNGVLALAWRSHRPVEPNRTVLFQAAALVAASIENARLVAAVETGLQQERLLTSRMRALVELTQLQGSNQGNGSEADRGGIHRLMTGVAEVIGAAGSAFGRVVGPNLVLEAVTGMAWDDAAHLINRPVAAMPVFAPSSRGLRAVLLTNASPEITAEARAFGRERGFETAAIFPILDESGLYGVIFCPLPLTVAEIELEIDERTLEAIGRVLDISFANIRLREGILASEARYRELFESSPDALLVQTIDEIVVDANPSAVRLYGSGLVGQRVEDLIADDPTRPGRPMGGLAGYTQYTGVGRRLDGTTFPEEVDLRPIEIDGEDRMLVIVRDLTERQQMQAELVQAQKMEAIGTLVAGVAHELNNPLASIVAFSQLIRTDPALPEDLRGQADLLVQEANRTRSIVKSLLDFARQQPPERTPTDLRALIESVLSLQSYMKSTHRLQVDVAVAADLPWPSIDQSQIQQVLINLTVNAAQAIQELGRPGRIRIEAREVAATDGRTVRISVADDGPGVSEDMVDRLFLPFVTSKEPGTGTGLGLSVSFGIVAGHGGTLRHEPNPGGGAVFVIELPVDRPSRDDGEDPAALPVRPTMTHAVARAVAHPDAAVLTSTTPMTARGAGPTAGDPLPKPETGRPRRILVLDDEQPIREVLARLLKRSGYAPILAATGPEALEIVAADPPDAILCDHRMAGMDGIEFHAAVVAIAPQVRRRFAFMSGDVLNAELRAFATAGGAQLLAKPFDLATVLAMLAGLLADESG